MLEIRARQGEEQGDGIIGAGIVALLGACRGIENLAALPIRQLPEDAASGISLPEVQ